MSIKKVLIIQDNTKTSLQIKINDICSKVDVIGVDVTPFTTKIGHEDKQVYLAVVKIGSNNEV